MQINCTGTLSVLQSANNLAQSQKSGKADDKKKNIEYAAAAWKQIVARYQVCTDAHFVHFSFLHTLLAVWFILCVAIISPPQSHLGRAALPTLMPVACASCAILTADESSHSAIGTLLPHHTYRHTKMAYTTLA